MHWTHSRMRACCVFFVGGQKKDWCVREENRQHQSNTYEGNATEKKRQYRQRPGGGQWGKTMKIKSITLIFKIINQQPVLLFVALDMVVMAAWIYWNESLSTHLEHNAGSLSRFLFSLLCCCAAVAMCGQKIFQSTFFLRCVLCMCMYVVVWRQPEPTQAYFKINSHKCSF